MADGLCGVAATTTTITDDGCSSSAAKTLTVSSTATNNTLLEIKNCQVKISDEKKTVNDQKSEITSIMNSVCVINERAETQKCEKNMSDAIKCPPSVLGATSLTALRKKKMNSATVVGSVSASASIMTNSLSDKQQKINGPNGLIKQPPPLHTAKDIDDIRKKRRCTDRYDSSESSDR